METSTIESQTKSVLSDARLAEFTALRSESDRCAQLLSNSVSAGIAGFTLTFLGIGAFTSNNSISLFVVHCVIFFLCVQSIAISMIYVAELWKQIRVGTYIRLYIEPPSEHEINWESWIVKHRSRMLHVVSFIFLQTPIMLTLLSLILVFCAKIGLISNASFQKSDYVNYLCEHHSLSFLMLLLILIDVLVIWIMARKINLAEKGYFGEGKNS